ncbi:MAG: tryptophan--tRNA ligase [Euryarchaeota archaeon]|nr:tryptophan--tRNA ligase [Euryarchaeota archaeon]
MDLRALEEDNERLVRNPGASHLSDIEELPDFPGFRNGLLRTHRDLDSFLRALRSGRRCAIVSGLNASGDLHLGHRAVLDTCRFFQEAYGVHVFVPISDDESYLSGKVSDQEQARKNALSLATQVLAYGFDPTRTSFLIDQVYTEIYNLAVRFSRRLTLSEVRAVYGYTAQENPGLYFYPAVQSAHILLPIVTFGFEQVLVPIGPDEDSHARVARDLAARFDYTKPAVLHAGFVPGLDGTKMSKSKGNAIGLWDDLPTLRRKVRLAFSGGGASLEEHRRVGGDPEQDVACRYLRAHFLSPDEGADLARRYRQGILSSGEVKERLLVELVKERDRLIDRRRQVSEHEVAATILRNPSSDLG